MNVCIVSGVVQSVEPNKFNSGVEVRIAAKGGTIALSLSNKKDSYQQNHEELHHNVGRRILFTCSIFGSDYNNKSGGISNSIKLYIKEFDVCSSNNFEVKNVESESQVKQYADLDNIPF